MHCSVLGRDALEKAVTCYLGEPEKKIEGEIVCECFGVTVRGTEHLVRIKPKVMTNLQKIKLIEESIEREINPMLKKDAGKLELVDVDGNRVLVRLGGSCASCAKSTVTLKHYVEAKLRELVTPELVVEEVD